ncbi:HD-GYP domain-containing protein [Oribacterium sp. WCC10]|uniref:HD-GYP domain-containing protein n=1 Tax=Oribacterium sp. WCC10 TaxID=1855343 RepID=UPI001FA8C19C|nr:HD-GYP domain-containing protein [Oribacterium sp. WCC10]
MAVKDFLIQHQLDLILFMNGVCGALVVMVLISKSIPRRRRHTLLFLESGSFFLLLFDRLAYIYRGDTSRLGYIMVRLSNFFVFMLSLAIIHGFNHFLKITISNENEDNRKVDTQNIERLLNINELVLMFGDILLVISQFTGFYYTIDEHNIYHRNIGMIVCYIVPLVVLIVQLVVVTRIRHIISRRMYIALFLFASVPVIATVIQAFSYGLSLTNLSTVGICMLLYVFSLIDMNEKAEGAKELEIKMLRDEQRHLQSMFEQTASALVSAIDAKDRYTHGHSKRVADYAVAIAQKAGKSDGDCKKIYYAALLHDVGKIGISDSILTKGDSLTAEERRVIMTHPTIGAQILSTISTSPYLCVGAHFHHERYDGKGYPNKICGEDIPEMARIIAVADSYDAMTSKRSYRDPLPQKTVRDIIEKGAGTQFDPVFAEIMLHMIDEDKDYKMKE